MPFRRRVFTSYFCCFSALAPFDNKRRARTHTHKPSSILDTQVVFSSLDKCVSAFFSHALHFAVLIFASTFSSNSHSNNEHPSSYFSIVINIELLFFSNRCSTNQAKLLSVRENRRRCAFRSPDIREESSRDFLLSFASRVKRENFLFYVLSLGEHEGQHVDLFAHSLYRRVLFHISSLSLDRVNDEHGGKRRSTS